MAAKEEVPHLPCKNKSLAMITIGRKIRIVKSPLWDVPHRDTLDYVNLRDSRIRGKIPWISIQGNSAFAASIKGAKTLRDASQT